MSRSDTSPSDTTRAASGFRGWFFEQLAMYMAYHRNARNQATHHVGVPVIVFAIMVAFTQIPITHAGDVAITGATLLLLVMALMYITAIPLVGICTVAFYAIVYVIAAQVGQAGSTAVWTVAVAAFVGGWIVQFVGHAFEGRRPALFTNIVQVLMAPPFLIAEMLFARGLEADLKHDLEGRSVKY